MQVTHAHIMVMVSAASEEEAALIARKLVEARLAACVQIMPIRSIYAWGGQLNDDREHLLLIKTRFDVLGALEALVRAAHSYDVPEITAVPIEWGSDDYLRWIDRSVGDEDSEV